MFITCKCPVCSLTILASRLSLHVARHESSLHEKKNPEDTVYYLSPKWKALGVGPARLGLRPPTVDEVKRVLEAETL